MKTNAQIKYEIIEEIEHVKKVREQSGNHNTAGWKGYSEIIAKLYIALATISK